MFVAALQGVTGVSGSIQAVPFSGSEPSKAACYQHLEDYHQGCPAKAGQTSELTTLPTSLYSIEKYSYMVTCIIHYPMHMSKG